MALAFCLFAAFQLYRMSAASRGVVYSLLTVVFVLLLGIAALLMVTYSRHQRLVDTTQDLRRSLDQQESQIKKLQQRLENCDTVRSAATTDTSWEFPPRESKNDFSFGK